MNGDLALLRSAIVEAGSRALAFRRDGLTIENKPGGSPVTNADLAIDAFLRETFMAARQPASSSPPP